MVSLSLASHGFTTAFASCWLNRCTTSSMYLVCLIVRIPAHESCFCVSRRSAEILIHLFRSLRYFRFAQITLVLPHVWCVCVRRNTSNYTATRERSACGITSPKTRAEEEEDETAVRLRARFPHATSAVERADTASIECLPNTLFFPCMGSYCVVRKISNALSRKLISFFARVVNELKVLVRGTLKWSGHRGKYICVVVRYKNTFVTKRKKSEGPSTANTHLE